MLKTSEIRCSALIRLNYEFIRLGFFFRNADGFRLNMSLRPPCPLIEDVFPAPCSHLTHCECHNF